MGPSSGVPPSSVGRKRRGITRSGWQSRGQGAGGRAGWCVCQGQGAGGRAARRQCDGGGVVAGAVRRRRRLTGRIDLPQALPQQHRSQLQARQGGQGRGGVREAGGDLIQAGASAHGCRCCWRCWGCSSSHKRSTGLCSAAGCCWSWARCRCWRQTFRPKETLDLHLLQHAGQEVSLVLLQGRAAPAPRLHLIGLQREG